MIGVEPSQLISAHQAAVNAAGVDGAQRERFKFKKICEGVAFTRLRWNVKNEVFYSYAPLALAIHTGLDRGDHAGLHRHVRIGHGFADALRALVHVQEITNAVARAMAKLDALGPQGRTRQTVEHGAGGAARKTRARQVHRAFQHQGVVAFHGRTHSADGPHAGDVGRATQVLAARVDEQETIAFNHRVGFVSGAVMRHGAVGVEPCNR